jgi:ligand-binding sensor domain-containing protein
VGELRALEPSRKISQYGHNVWRIQDGYLPAAPEAIAQTADGQLWVGTAAGLVRFAVEEFQTFVRHLEEPFRTLALLCVCFGFASVNA